MNENLDRDKWFEMLEQYVLLFPEVCRMPLGMTKTAPAVDIKMALDKAQKQVQIHNELKLARTGLIVTVGAFETVSSFLPYIDLQGVTDNVTSQIEAFDSVLKELSIKYIANMAPSPETMLVMMVGRIAFTTHITNKRNINNAHSTPILQTPVPPSKFGPSSFAGLHESAKDTRESLDAAAFI